MGIQALQKFIETNCPGACVPVDLLKIARSVSVVRRGRMVGSVCGGRGGPLGAVGPRLCLVVDGECCLDRLYGGYYSDWVCGGQWNRMVQFLAVLIQTVQHNDIELAVFFNGGLEPQRLGEWVLQQQNERKKINQVLKHVSTKGTPPPKVWWVPPICLATCLRMALRHLNVGVVCTMDDHRQEVIACCRENSFHGLMAEDAEYAIFDPPRYFSSEQLKLTYKGSLETKEFILDEVAKGLDLHPNRFCVFAALLGNYLLTEEDLLEFYKTICSEAKNKQVIPSDILIKAVCNYVRDLPNIDNLDAIGLQVFGSCSSPSCLEERIQKFKQCVQYYLNGTNDGFLRYRPSSNARRYEPGHYPPARPFNNSPAITNVPQQASRPPINNQQGPASSVQNDSSLVADPSRFASETAESEMSSLTAYQAATGAFAAQIPAPQIIIEPPTNQQQALKRDGANQNSIQSTETVSSTTTATTATTTTTTTAAATTTSTNTTTSITANECNHENLNGSNPQRTGTSERGTYDTWVNGIANNNANVGVSSSASGCYPVSSNNKSCANNGNCGIATQLPNVPPEVMRTASERHQKGLMTPWIYQILSQGEIKIPLSIEEEVPKDLPSAALLYRPVRQMVYAILFNMHHIQFLAKQKGEHNNKDSHKSVDITVREWVWSKNNPYKSAEEVKAVPLGWAVPTVQRLWFGAALDDKKRRLRAFLTCMHSDTPLMLNTSNVPQHLLIMCCVLRYIISCNDRRILRKQELDAFLAQAVSPQLMDAQFMQNMQLPLITTRGVQLAALFMRGVEAALFANDSCGAPVPWLMCCPWLFFDGKLFHHKLLKANSAKNLVEICDGQLDEVAKVERMRQAILEGLDVEFARPPLPMMAPSRMQGLPPNGPPMMPAGSNFPMRGRGRGILAADVSGGGVGRAIHGRRGMLARGGQLEIAGVVVGSWGPNFGTANRGRSLQMPPQVTSVGGMRRYGAVPGMTIPRGGYTACSLKRVPRIRGKFIPQMLGPRKKVRKPIRYVARSSYDDDDDSNDKYTALGRGCTVQAVANNVIPPRPQVLQGAGDAPDVTQNGQFEDAREDTANKTVIMKKGQVETQGVVANSVAMINGSKSGEATLVPEDAE